MHVLAWNPCTDGLFRTFLAGFCLRILSQGPGLQQHSVLGPNSVTIRNQLFTVLSRWRELGGSKSTKGEDSSVLGLFFSNSSFFSPSDSVPCPPSPSSPPRDSAPPPSPILTPRTATHYRHKQHPRTPLCPHHPLTACPARLCVYPVPHSRGAAGIGKQGRKQSNRFADQGYSVYRHSRHTGSCTRLIHKQHGHPHPDIPSIHIRLLFFQPWRETPPRQSTRSAIPMPVSEACRGLLCFAREN